MAARKPAFTVPSGRLAGDYDGVIISTDLEPDDALALKVLAPKLMGVPLLVVVGQGAFDKRTMVAEILATYGIDSGATVVQGKTSKASFPDGVAEAYHDEARAHKCTLHDGGEAAVLQLCTDFLQKCEKPFALLLKPPHEFVGLPPPLLGKTAAALYGSFNLSELREEFKKAGGPKPEAELFDQQFGLMRAFKALLWIERSESCGRDCVVEPATCAPAVWHAIDADAALTRHIALWNADTLRSMAAKISKLPDEVSGVLGTDISRLPNSADFGKLGAAVERYDKRMKILLSITACEGKQVCHADTLVAASLLDASGALSRFERPVELALNASNNKPTFARDEGSSVVGLMAAAGGERDALVKASFAILEQALFVA